jgi:hypothetical protein
VLILILIYLILIIAGATISGLAVLSGSVVLPAPYLNLPFLCAMTGAVGGCVYCLRGVYVHRCVEKNWSPDWYVWYFLRPIISTICGAVSYLFLKAGLLVLESKEEPGASQLGFYALAFIAGLNVDKFIAKIEDIAQAVWGIEKSRASRSKES